MSGQNEVGCTESSSPLPPPPPPSETNVVYVTGSRPGRCINGRCPYCGIGRPVTNISPGGLCCAIICCIICLPLGVCCFCDFLETRCSHCKAPLA